MGGKRIKTKTSGVYIRHRVGCPAEQGGRCRCEASYVGRRRDPITKQPQWSPNFRSRAEVLTWLGARHGGAEIRARLDLGPSFKELATEWLTGVQQDAIGKRRGSGKYSPTTLAGYQRSLESVLMPMFYARPASEITPAEWQAWIDRMAREGYKRSTIANHVAVARAIYGWATRATRQLVPVNPLLGVEMPPENGIRRERVAPHDEAAMLIAALSVDDRVPYAIAFYTGMRRAEIHRLRWEDIELTDLGGVATVRKAKSAAGTGRQMPIAKPLRPLLRDERLRQGQPDRGPVSPVSVMSGKLAVRATDCWNVAGLKRITLHEARHTYASYLMAAGYNLKHLMEFMGHSSLQATERYVKILPQPGDLAAGTRLDAYFDTAKDAGA